ncbi:hypothetical protein MTZ49_11070 [Entomomonas sp. E2T0]|uniref:hypothetical protein n=1 Tax=Entomomonas sp. E2T0 TaxID=2930213 RepID=UPI0022282140|nr:hypothetical protein [Entomomonas sp. E2T0]UYZ83139.1 hypothetical protein MTZ49_11070 [Entomomonas sp. E2T0]
MTFRYLLVLAVPIFCTACSKNVEVISTNIVNKPDSIIPLEICFNQQFSNRLKAKITVVTKDNLIFSRQDIALSFDHKNKTNCLSLNAGKSLLPKRAPKELRMQARNSLKNENIKSIDIKLSQNSGPFYNSENQITEYLKTF